MTPDEYKNLIEWHRHILARIQRLEVMIAFIFLATVVVPIMKQMGWSNWLGMGE